MGGQPAPSAFRLDDLKGGENHVSVDRMDTAKREYILPMLVGQRSKADPGKSIHRETAYSALLLTGNVRNAVDGDGRNPFGVRGAPVENNPAHCGIVNVTRETGVAYRRKLRTILLEQVNELMSFDECFPKENR